MSKYVKLFLLPVLFLVACTKAEMTAPPSKNLKQSGDTTAVVVPHTISFFKAHGQAYLENKTQCSSCHNAANAAANPKLNCNSCHESFPHNLETWKQKTNHAAEYLKNPQACATCHGVDGAGGTSRISCQNCHSYPHPKKWAVPENHGKTFAATAMEDRQTKCLTCHDTTKAEGNAPKCQGCHDAYPTLHTDNWKSADSEAADHHAKYKGLNSGSCLNCHKDYTANMPNFSDCTICHPGGPVLKMRWEPAPALRIDKLSK
jgi:hypothetical protein